VPGPDHSHSLAARATHRKIVVYKNRSTERIFGQSPAGTPIYGEPACQASIDDLEVGSLHVVDTGDDFDDEERERLHRALDAANESVQAGRTVDGNEVMRRLPSRP
jgi:hypothetical protein